MECSEFRCKKNVGYEGYSAKLRQEIRPEKVEIFSMNLGLGLAH